MNKISALATMLIMCANASYYNLRMPTMLYTKWQNDKSMNALIATTYAEKVAATEAGYLPIGSCASTHKPAKKRNMRLLQDQQTHFVMVPAADLMLLDTDTKAIRLPISSVQVTGTKELIVPQRLRTILSESNLPSNAQVQEVRMNYQLH